MDGTVLEKLTKWVTSTYSPRKCGWTAERSMGNYDDCFEDGSESGASWAAYEVGSILGLNLKNPETSDE